MFYFWNFKQNNTIVWQMECVCIPCILSPPCPVVCAASHDHTTSHNPLHTCTPASQLHTSLFPSSQCHSDPSKFTTGHINPLAHKSPWPLVFTVQSTPWDKSLKRHQSQQEVSSVSLTDNIITCVGASQTQGGRVVSTSRVTCLPDIKQHHSESLNAPFNNAFISTMAANTWNPVCTQKAL